MIQFNKWMLAAIPAAICSAQVLAATAWDSKTVYTGGQVVSYQGKDYKAKWWTLNNIPGTEQWGPWELVGNSTGSTPAPTAVVTAAPTTAPTTAPTSVPTSTPTAKPSATPTIPPAAGSCAAWVEGNSYKAGDVVNFGGASYTALSTHTAYVGANWNPAATPTLWKAGGNCSTGGSTPAPTATPVVTVAPTATPVVTATPTAKPSATPVVTATPTATPVVTVKPTATPTATPVVTVAPTPVVTAGPTAAPTSAPAAYKPQITYITAPAGYPTDAQFTAAERALYSQAGGDAQTIDRIREALQVRADSVVDAVAPGLASNPDNVQRVERVLPRAKFDYFFPVRNVKYTYENLLKGVAKFPAYCKTYTDGRDSDLICKKLLATSFAHFAQETGANWPALTPATARGYADQNNAVLATMEQNTAIPTFRQGLWFLREQGMQEGSGVGGYQDCFNGAGGSIFSIFYPCGKNAQGQYFSYFGRGSKQLSWNYNYGPFSKSLYGDVNVLLDNPGLVADTWMNFASAIWFAVYPQSPKPPMTWVVDGTWQPNQVDIANNMKPGFGATTYIINGGIECGKGSEAQQSLNRIAAYKEFTKELGIDISNEQLTCGTSKGFTDGSAAATKTYLDKNWGYNGNNPGGVSWACQLVSYQTPFSLANTGDYKACVDYFFRGQVKFNGQIVVDNTK
ncbi:glycoside hydrolase family 19 protein [Chitinibacter sp. ZOR0017]|uniref:glycoside hydrolase family 19 protein n=1 Tax=Chitinibacter sp. ZOR0017 TaxID=1339254 RepID=UPI000B1B31B0|nr:glycoside hydrolase family 19 protein [Chitinibacter sp. ZOR0017]